MVIEKHLGFAKLFNYFFKYFFDVYIKIISFIIIIIILKDMSISSPDNINNNNKNNKNFIHKDVKSNKDFQNILSLMCRADAQHDIHFLKKEFKENKGILNSFASALPAYPTISWDEEDCLKNIFLNQQQHHTLEEVLDQVPDVTQSKLNKIPVLFDIGFTNIVLHTFSCTKFVISSTNNKAKNLIPASGDIATNFCVNTDFCGISNNAILIIDYNQHGFLSIFKEGNPSSLFNIHYVINPEVINDPAPKTSVHDSIFSSTNITNGIKLNSYVESSILETMYSRYDPNNIGTNNNFFSEYHFNLSPVQSIYTKQKAEKLITNLNIYWNNENTKQPFTDNISDSKGENSNKTVSSYIQSIIKKITTVNNNQLNFDFNTKCQQKRGGDWFQALSCFDINNREFTNIQNRTEGAKAFPLDYPVYFVTHDRIAVSFALLMGVNVIYLDYYGCVFVFKNQADENTKSSNKTYEEGLFEMLQNQFSSSASKGISEISKYLSFNSNYNVARENILKREYQEIKDIITQANKEIVSIDNQHPKFIANYQRIVKNIFQHLFPMMVKYFFLASNLIDTKEDVVYIQKNQNILLQENYSPNVKEQVLKLYLAYNRIHGVYTIHGGGSKDLIENSIILWGNNVTKLDVYRSAKNLLNIESYQDKKTFDLRLLNYNTNSSFSNEKRINDIYIFLPYIQTLQEDLKKMVLEFTNGPLFNKTMEYRNSISTGKSIFRLNRLSPNEVFFNQIANFIYELRIFLDSGPVFNVSNSSFDSNQNTGEAAIGTGEAAIGTGEAAIGTGEAAIGTGEAEVGTGEAEVGPLPVSTMEEPIQEKVFQLPRTENIKMEPLISLSTDAILIAEDFYEITYTRGMGKFTNSSAYISEEEEEEPLNPEVQIGGFQYYETRDSSKKINNDVTIDLSIRQITWPLLTNILLSDGLNNINKNKILHYLSEREKEEEKNTLDTNSSLTSRDSRKRSNSSFAEEEEGNRPNGVKRERNDFLGGSPMNTNNNINENDLIDLLNTITNKSGDNKKINLGYHPLVPIYMILSSMWYFVSPNLSNDCFYDTYLNYFDSLEKMTYIIMENYLNRNKWIQAFFIGFALKIFFFQSYSSLKMGKDLTELLQVETSSYQMYSLKNDMFGNYIAGYFLSESEEIEQMNNTLLFSDLFKNFLVKEVNLSSFIEKPNFPTEEEVLDPEEFQEKIYILMKKIVERIEKDKWDNEMSIEPPSSSSLSSLSSSNNNNNSYNNSLNTKTKKSIDKYGNIINVPINAPKKGIYTLNDFPNLNNSNSNNNSMVYNSSSTNSNYGGNQSNSKKKKKKTKKIIKTIKKRKNLEKKKSIKTIKTIKKRKNLKKKKTIKKKKSI